MTQTNTEDLTADETTNADRPATAAADANTLETIAMNEPPIMPATPTPAVKTLTASGKTFTTPFADLLPPQTAGERQRLRDDIKFNGIKVPIVVTDDDEVIDGHHRLGIAAELGLALADIPIRVEAGLTAEQKKALAVTLNTHRRQLSPEQVQAVIARLLAADPEASDRQIAAQANVDHKTIGRQRERMVASGALPRSTATKGKDGRTRKRPPAKPKATKPPAPVVTPARPDAKGSELGGIANALARLAVSVRGVARRKRADRSPESVCGCIEQLDRLRSQLQEVADSHAAGTPSPGN